MSYFYMLKQKCLPVEVGILEIIPGISKFQIFEISGFGEVKCGAPGFREVKRRNLRTLDIRPLTASRDALLFWVLYYASTQKSRTW